MSTTIRHVEGLWLWEVERGDGDYMGTCETRAEAEVAAAAAEQYDGGSDDAEHIASLEAEVAALRARAEAAEAAGFQRAISAALAIIDARHDKITATGTECSPYHAGMADALCWASDEVEELAAKAKTEGVNQ